MPGIAGLYSNSGYRSNPNLLDDMLKCMLHESYYTSGTYKNADLGLQVGWVSFNNPSSGQAPEWNEKKDRCLIFVGEAFDDDAERRRLSLRGHILERESTNYLIHLYEEEGIDFLKRISGPFSGILIDLQMRSFFLFNDRYGVNKVYIHEAKEGLLFASEAKALLKVNPSLRRLNYSSLAAYINSGYVSDDNTLYSGVSLLPAASVWKFSTNCEVQKKKYFHLDFWENQPKINKANFSELLEEKFRYILPKYYRTNERLAVATTGGVSTSLIFAWAEFPPYKVPCYTFGSMYRDGGEFKKAKTVAALIQQRHERIQITRRFITDFPALVKRAIYYTDGCSDARGSIDLYVSKLAREIAPISIVGTLGNQLLRGYFVAPFILTDKTIIHRDFLPYFHREKDNNLAGECKIPLSSFIEKEMKHCYSTRLILANTQLTLRLPYLDNDFIGVMYQANLDSRSRKQIISNVISNGNSALSRLLKAPGPLYRLFNIADRDTYGDDIPKLLVRLDGGVQSSLMRKVFVDRKTYYHFRIWYKDLLSKYVKDVLLDSCCLTRPYLNGRRIEEIVKAHIEGRSDYTEEIHRLLACELIQRHLIKSS